MISSPLLGSRMPKSVSLASWTTPPVGVFSVDCDMGLWSYKLTDNLDVENMANHLLPLISSLDSLITKEKLIGIDLLVATCQVSAILYEPRDRPRESSPSELANAFAISSNVFLLDLFGFSTK